VNALTVAKELDRRGVALHSINEKLDTKSAMGRFFFTLLASVAEMERYRRRKDIGRAAHRRDNATKQAAVSYRYTVDAEANW